MPCLLWNINWDNVPFWMQQGVVCQTVPQQNYGNICKKYPAAIGVPCTGHGQLGLRLCRWSLWKSWSLQGEAKRLLFRGHVCIPVAYYFSAAAQLKALQVRCVISWPYFSHWIKPQAALWMPKPFFSHVCPLHSHLFHVTVHCSRPFTAHP